MNLTKIAGCLVVAVCCFLGSCSKQSEREENKSEVQAQNQGNPGEVKLTMQAQKEQRIDVATVEQSVAVLSQRAKGRIALPDNATWRVGVLTEGRVEKVYSNLGDRVEKAQVLARMHSHDVHEARAAYANAITEHSRLEAAEALAEKNYERSQRLLALKAESVSETETARQEVVNAQAAAQEAENNIRQERAHLVEILGISAEATAQNGEDADLIPIVAPASGRILQKNVTPGSTISPSNDAFVIGDLTRLWMLASVDAATLARLHRNQRARIIIPGVPDETFAGILTNLGQEFDPTTRLIQVRIEILHPDARLRPEMLATAEFDSPSGGTVLEVPQQAMQQVNGQDVVFLRLSSDTFRVQPVQAGEIIQDKVRILQGLKPGDQVITRGSFIAKGQLLKSTIGE
jgi:cobalt-zinc-cadmium efflux system membrane fusion protein